MKTTVQRILLTGSILVMTIFQSCSTSNQASISEKSLTNLSYPMYELGNYYTEPERYDDMLMVLMKERINYNQYNLSLANAIVGGFYIAAEKAAFNDKIAVVLVKNKQDIKVYITQLEDWQRLLDKKISVDQFIEGINVVTTTFSEISMYASR